MICDDWERGARLARLEDRPVCWDLARLRAVTRGVIAIGLVLVVLVERLRCRRVERLVRGRRIRRMTRQARALMPSSKCRPR